MSSPSDFSCPVTSHRNMWEPSWHVYINFVIMDMLGVHCIVEHLHVSFWMADYALRWHTCTCIYMYYVMCNVLILTIQKFCCAKHGSVLCACHDVTRWLTYLFWLELIVLSSDTIFILLAVPSPLYLSCCVTGILNIIHEPLTHLIAFFLHSIFWVHSHRKVGDIGCDGSVFSCSDSLRGPQCWSMKSLTITPVLFAFGCITGLSSIAHICVCPHISVKNTYSC